MIGFWCGAAALSLLAWVMLCGPTFARRRRQHDAVGANLAVLRHQLTVLDAELAAGVIDVEEHRAARSEIEQRVLQEAPADSRSGPADTPAHTPASIKPAPWLALCIPLAAFGIYGFVGNLDGALQSPSFSAPSASAPLGGSLRSERDRVAALMQMAATGNERLPASISGTIRVAPELASRVRPTDTVFVFAREAGATGMPLAAARFSASDLPLSYTLDDASAPMAGARKLADARNLVVSARISKRGDAIAAEGDLHGEAAANVSARETVDVTISSIGR
ncbi:MAG: c-type cytochrome biogenesis protein CcmI [Variovorax sp.]